jgi:hypothetical protein
MNTNWTIDHNISRKRPEQFLQLQIHRTEAIFIDALTFGATQVRCENHACPVVRCVIDGRKRGANPGVVINATVFDRNVEINADEDAFTGEVEIANG